MFVFVLFAQTIVYIISLSYIYAFSIFSNSCELLNFRCFNDNNNKDIFYSILLYSIKDTNIWTFYLLVCVIHPPAHANANIHFFRLLL